MALSDMENPSTWTPAQHVIADAIRQWQDDDTGVVGHSEATVIYNRLRDGGFLADYKPDDRTSSDERTANAVWGALNEDHWQPFIDWVISLADDDRYDWEPENENMSAAEIAAERSQLFWFSPILLHVSEAMGQMGPDKDQDEDRIWNLAAAEGWPAVLQAIALAMRQDQRKWKAAK